jgi:hypothetical protein
MLSPADADLARRDAAVPGLARLLDPDALRQTVQSVASHLGIANLNYVRYKPGTSCLIGFDLVHKGQKIPAWGLALNSEDSEKFVKGANRKPVATALGERPIACHDDRVLIGCFPLDPDLDQLPRLADEQRRRKLLRRILREHPALHGVIPELLAYRRARRYVAKVAGANDAACLRFYTSDSFPAAARAAWALRAAAGSPTCPGGAVLLRRGLHRFHHQADRGSLVCNE